MPSPVPLVAPSSQPAVWLRCRQCGRPLVALDIHEGQTCVQLLGLLIVREADVRCPGCGQVRRFRSVPARPPAAAPRT